MKSTTGKTLEGLPPEVALANAPLVRVIAQVRFPTVLSVQDENFVRVFQELVREHYPILRPAQTHSVVPDAQGQPALQINKLWRFSSTDESWRLTLGKEFLSLETTKYCSRSDFMRRLKFGLEALKKGVHPTTVDRLGIRYVDRVVGGNVDDLNLLVKSEIAWILETDLFGATRHTISEGFFDVPDAGCQLVARWGLLPPNATIDPNILEPVEERSWILDLDAFRTANKLFDVDALIKDANVCAEAIYRVFRKVVTDEFLRRYGGNL